MSAIIAIHADGVFCDTTHEIPNTEPDLHAMRWYRNLAEGSPEQLVVTCENENTAVVQSWLRTFGIRFSVVLALKETRERERAKELIRFVATQQSKLVLYIGARFNDCNHMADLGVPTLRYIAPTSRVAWEFDPRDSWQEAVAKQGGE